MNSFIRAILILLLTILLQVVIFRFGVFAGGRALIFFHLYGIVLFPIGWHKTSYLFICTFSGLILDIILLTGGLHMAAGAFLGLLLPHLSNGIAPRDGFLKEHVIGALKDGWMRFIIYCFIIASVYSFAIFAIEGGRIGLIPSAIWKAILTGGVSVILMGITQGLFGLKRKNKKSKVSAYPWS
jgi:hypothetical protein